MTDKDDSLVQEDDASSNSDALFDGIPASKVDKADTERGVNC